MSDFAVGRVNFNNRSYSNDLDKIIEESKKLDTNIKILKEMQNVFKKCVGMLDEVIVLLEKDDLTEEEEEKLEGLMGKFMIQCIKLQALGE